MIMIMIMSMIATMRTITNTNTTTTTTRITKTSTTTQGRNTHIDTRQAINRGVHPLHLRKEQDRLCLIIWSRDIGVGPIRCIRMRGVTGSIRPESAGMDTYVHIHMHMVM
jgi:hypothetical protein